MKGKQSSSDNNKQVAKVKSKPKKRAVKKKIDERNKPKKPPTAFFYFFFLFKFPPHTFCHYGAGYHGTYQGVGFLLKCGSGKDPHREDFRKVYQEEHPEVKSMRDIGKACGVKWKTMTYEEKVQYYDIATEKRAEFDKATAEYIKRKESGEDEDMEESDYYE